jgi:ligand-binding SRPBCC domain-containing protein
MKPYILKRKQVVEKPLEEVFEFFSRPENLSRITPPEMGFNIITPIPIDMNRGSLIDYTVKVLGPLAVRWTSLISEYDPPHKFVDVQLRGPYSFWHHTHTFKSIAGGTEITDEVRYLIPMGIIGNLAHALFVRKKLEQIFDFRRHVIGNYFK